MDDRISYSPPVKVPLRVVSLIAAFLKERGLELSQEKTRVTHVTEGFDFLGQNVRKYPSWGKLKLLIKPAKKNIHSFLEEIRKVFRKSRSTTQADLIKILNPKLRGWANYHRSVVSKETFSKIDAIIWHLCFRWAKRRHPDKRKRWVLEQYFKPIKGRNYRFSGFEKLEDGTLQQQTLLIMSYTSIRRHVKILQPAHPYDRKYDEYFEKRTSGKWKNNSQRLSIESYINMIQQGKCPIQMSIALCKAHEVGILEMKHFNTTRQARKIGGDEKTVQRWVNIYQQYGKRGLELRHGCFDGSFKVRVIKHILRQK